MGSDFPIFEIVIFGMIAAFFILRLKNTLGKRTGHEQQEPRSRVRMAPDDRAAGNNSADDNVIHLPGAEAQREQAPAFDEANATPLERGLHEIGQADRSFDPAGFMQGARGAYEMIVTSFAQGDKKALKPLLASRVYQNFCDAIDQRKAEDLTQETELVGFNSVDIVEARMVDRNAEVTVKFVAEMISVTRNKDGEIVSGEAEDVSVVTDIWTFSKDTRSRNPNWELISTRSAH
ncbi:MAG: Tim44/TimA family putative adaptor protein [Minwuia sp.]|uniref:Tim44/TimA family putative adaptor protein n=1 Tax=Minwuia sp. TaxID=2493630 RepID=UPI003A89944A